MNVFALAFSLNIEACPYQKMAEVDSKIYSQDNKIEIVKFIRFKVGEGL